jgi:hypothetical protein
MIEIQLATLQAALAAVAVLVGLGVGYAVVRSIKCQKPAPIKLGGIEALDACRLACDQWDGARSERCQAEADEAAAKDRVNTDQIDLGIAIAAQAAALAAALAAYAIPVIGWIIAIPFWVTYNSDTFLGNIWSLNSGCCRPCPKPCL